MAGIDLRHDHDLARRPIHLREQHGLARLFGESADEVGGDLRQHQAALRDRS